MAVAARERFLLLGGGSVTIASSGSTIVSGAKTLNFTGAGVSVTDAGSGQANIAISGGGGGSYNEVATYADLPVTVGTPAVGSIVYVQGSTGAWYTFNKREMGFYRRIANNGNLADWKVSEDTYELTLDSTFALADEGDTTKRLQFDCASITTATTRVLSIPNANGTIALTLNKLSTFGATTSAELASVISDETGTGLLVFSASPTLTGSPVIASATGTQLTLYNPAATTSLLIRADAGTSGNVVFQTGTSNRWTVYRSSEAESGSNAGSNFGIQATADNGITNLGDVVNITRATRAVLFPGILSVGSGPTVHTDAAGKILSAALNTVAVAQGGTGVTSSTGTVAVVLSTSPTLVTPLLGTPTSGTLTNCTGLPISTGVSGLAANVATFLGTPSSANLAAAVTDETGSGLLVFATSPSFTTPVLGTPTSGNLSNCTADGTNAVGFLQIPQNSKSAAYTTVLADGGKHIYHPGADTTARTWTIDSNANVAYPVGTTLTFVNDTSAGVVTIAITSDTLVLAGTGTTGSRTLAANGVATAVKMTTTRWQINGTGLT